jgi:MFS family permease
LSGLRLLVVFVGTVVFVDTVFYAVITPLLPELVDEFDLSKGEAGRLSATYPAGTLLASLPAAWLATRVGVRTVTLWALALLAASSLAFAFATSAHMLELARFVQGLSGAGTWAGAFAWLIGAAPRARRGEMIGTVMGIAIAGALFGPVLGGVASSVGREVVFSAVAAIAAGLAIWALRMPAADPGRPPRMADLTRAVTNRLLLAGLAITLLPGLLFGTVSVLAPLRLDELGTGTQTIAAAFLIGAALEGVLSPLVGRYSDRHGRRLPVLCGLALSVVGALLFPWPETAWVLIGLVALSGIFFGILWTPAMATVSDAAENLAVPQTFALGLNNMAWAVGQTAGAGGGAALADATSDKVAFFVLAALAGATLFVLVRSPFGRLQPGNA